MSLLSQSRLRQNRTKGFQPLQLLGLGAFAVFPGGVKDIHIRDRELVHEDIAARIAVGPKLLNKGAVLTQGRGLNAAILAR